mgnify:FL=1
MNKLFNIPEEVKTTLLSQECRTCPETVELEVPTFLWDRYKGNTKDIVEVFDPAIWTAPQREVILNSQRQHNNMMHYFMCDPCWAITFKDDDDE